jgi:DNA-binding GntR family transcriptional regulator
MLPVDCSGEIVARELHYMRVAAVLRRLVSSGEVLPGQLPASESELADEHGVSRVTIRKALAQLKSDGVLDSRQGFGWYVIGPPLRQSLRDLTTIQRQIRAAGREPSRELLAFAFRPTPSSRRVDEHPGEDPRLGAGDIHAQPGGRGWSPRVQRQRMRAFGSGPTACPL